MSTIEERLEDLTNEAKLYNGNPFGSPLDEMTAAITADWTTAIDLLRQSLLPLQACIGEYDQDSDKQLYRKIEKHIVKMEGTE